VKRAKTLRHLAPKHNQVTSKVLVGQFLLEANTFVPGQTDLSDFEKTGLWVGEDLKRSKLPEEDELSAAWDFFETVGWEVIPSIRAWMGAGAPISETAFETIEKEILDRIDENISCVFLSLHGASAAINEGDPEGRLLKKVRQKLGFEKPIAISLDCHAGITTLMIDNADIITGYRTVPHIDLSRTGKQAAELLYQTINKVIDPVMYASYKPMIAPAHRQDNEYEPFGSLMNMCEIAEKKENILSAAFFPSHPWRDVPELSWSSVVVANKNIKLAKKEAENITDYLWESRKAFTEITDLEPMSQTLAVALDAPLPAVIADAGDSPSGGSLGDSTELLRSALKYTNRHIWMTILDVEAAQVAKDTEVNETIKISLGTGEENSFNEKTEILAKVLSHPEGTVEYEASLAKGKRGHLGKCALLGIENLKIIVHDQPVMLIDAAPYKAAGLIPSDAEVIQAKSHTTFRSGFQKISKSFFVANTPGPTPIDLTNLDYVNRPRPLHPFETTNN